jgi:hypothetical protein
LCHESGPQVIERDEERTERGVERRINERETRLWWKRRINGE